MKDKSEIKLVKNYKKKKHRVIYSQYKQLLFKTHNCRDILMYPDNNVY